MIPIEISLDFRWCSAIFVEQVVGIFFMLDVFLLRVFVAFDVRSFGRI